MSTATSSFRRDIPARSSSGCTRARSASSGTGRNQARGRGWCPGAELNRRHRAFQARALPTELPGLAARPSRPGTPLAERQAAKRLRVISGAPRIVKRKGSMLALLTLLPLILAQQPASPPAATPAPAPAPAATGSALPGEAGLEVLWARTLSEATEGAKRLKDGRILILFVEPNCGQCDRMEALVVPSTSFYAFTRDKVPLYEDVSTPEGKDLARQLKVRGARGPCPR